MPPQAKCTREGFAFGERSRDGLFMLIYVIGVDSFAPTRTHNLETGLSRKFQCRFIAVGNVVMLIPDPDEYRQCIQQYTKPLRTGCRRIEHRR